MLDRIWNYPLNPTYKNLKSRNQRQFINVIEHQLNATHLSPRWGFRAGFTLFSIHLSPRWGFVWSLELSGVVAYFIVGLYSDFNTRDR